MPNLGNTRQYHGPNGPFNYISDNPLIALTRDVNDRVIQIDLTTVLGTALRKTITRDVNGNVTNVSRWFKP